VGRRGVLRLLAAGAAAACRPLRVEAGRDRPPGPRETAGEPVPQPTASPLPGAVPRPTATAAPSLGKLAYVQGGDLWVKEPPDGEARRLTQDGRNGSPLWSPSGGWLAFRKGPQLWVARGAGTDARAVDGARSGPGQPVAWSPVADRIAYATPDGLFVESADGAERRRLVATPAREGSGVLGLAWSPDGRWLAFERLEWGPEGTPVRSGLFRVKTDGSEVHPLHLNPDGAALRSHLAGWAPDGRAVLFWQGILSASIAMDGLALRLVPAAGGAAAEISPAVLLHPDLLAWSPDGRRLAFVDGGGRMTWANKTLAVADASLRVERLSPGGRADLHPAWSPDGRWIAHASGPAEPRDAGGDGVKRVLARRRIRLVAPDGSGTRQLTDDARFRDERPRWSADGTHLLLARLEDEQAQLWLMRADGSGQRRVVEELTPGPGWHGTYGHLEWGRLYDWWTGPPAGRPAAPLPPGSAASPEPGTPSAVPAVGPFEPASFRRLARPDDLTHEVKRRGSTQPVYVVDPEVVVRVPVRGVERLDVAVTLSARDTVSVASGRPDADGIVELRLHLPEAGVVYVVQGLAVLDGQGPPRAGGAVNGRGERVLPAGAFLAMAEPAPGPPTGGAGDDAWAALRARLPSEAPVYRPTWLPDRFRRRPPLAPAPGPYVGVTHRGDDGDLLVFAVGPTNSAPPTRAEPVGVRGRAGQLVFSDGSPPLQVVWTEGGRAYSVRAEIGAAARATVTGEEMLRIVASLAPVGPDGAAAALPAAGGPAGAALPLAGVVGALLVGAGAVVRRRGARR
jgi:Tol biopolymer transport system component